MRAAALGLVTALVVGTLSGCLIGTGPATDDEGKDAIDAVVVAQQALASDVGASIIRAGGNAIDAAAAVQFALTVVEPQFSGIGGGAFLLYYEASSGRLYTLDGREKAPAASTADQFSAALVDATWDPTVMGTSVGVPGTVRLFEEALARWGTMDLAAVTAPAVRLAEEGFPVPQHLASDIGRMRHRIETWPASAALYLPGSVCAPTQAGFAFVTYTVPRCTGGEPPAPGARLANPDLAQTLRLIGDGGSAAFYSGPVAEAIVAAQAERDGRMTLDDLAAYEVVDRDPLHMSWKGLHLFTMDMPSSAITMLQMLRMLEDDDLARLGWGSTETLHRLIEAMHLAYADRAAYQGDEDFVEVPQNGLLHPDYVAARRALIGPEAQRDVRAGDPWAYEDERPGDENRPARGARTPDRDHHTSHFTIIDHDGNIVVCTTTIEHYFGSGMVVPGYGFFLNNELTDFDWAPGGPNEVEPGKRPRSSMSPTLVFEDGVPVLTVGSPGGSTIITTVFQVLLNVLEHGMSITDAVAAPRIYSPIYPGVAWEEGLDARTRDDLEARGHDLAESVSVIGAVQALERLDDGRWIGAADPRRGGSAVTVPASA